MAGDNTLGAPTEGLGQTVTFGFKNQGSQQSQGVQRGRIRAGVQGSAASNVQLAQGAKVEQDPAVDMLMRVGAGLIDTKIKEARTTAYVTGMQRAMNGEAVDDIAAKQPAWSRVFGESDAVEGARAYSAEKKVQDTLLSIENDLPNLKHLGPKEANEYFTKSVNAALTGHAATDNAIMSAIQRNLPSVMKRQATAHYGYMQEEAATQEAGAISSAATRLQAAGTALAKGEITADDFAEQQAALSMLTVPAIGRDPEWVRKQRTASALMMAEQGQFHALNAMQKVGIFDVLHPEQKAQIIRSRQANESQWKAKYGGEFANDIAELKIIDENIKLGQKPGWTPEMTMDKVRDINRRYKERTGSESDYFNADILAGYGEQTARGIAALQHHQMVEAAAARKAAQVAGNKALEAQALQSTLSIAGAQGNLASAVAMGLVKDNDADKWFMPQAIEAISNVLANKPGSFDMLIKNGIGGYINKPVKNQLGVMVHGAVADGAMTASFAATFEAWRRINEQSPETAAGYYGDAHAKFQRFQLAHPGPIDLAKPSPFLQSAFAGSFGPGAKSYGANIDKKEFTALVKKSSEIGNSGKWLPEMLGGDNRLRPGQAEVIANHVLKRAEVLADSAPLDQAMHGAILVGSQADLNIVGGYAWYDAKNRDFVGEIQKKLSGKFGLGSKLEASQDFGEFLDEQIKKVGGMTTPKVMRMDDSLIITDIVDGEARNVRVTLDAVAEELMKRGKARRGAAPKVYTDGTKSAWYRFGPEITSTEKRAPDGTPLVPSPYASPEEWAAYRKNQATK
jgi:hypothetical protein